MAIRCRHWALLGALALVAGPTAALAQSYPARPIRWVVPYTPGGLTDNVTRWVTAKLQEALGQPIVIENKPGANSITGADAVATAQPDGYTLLTVIAAFAANDTLYAGKLPYDTRKSLVPDPERLVEGNLAKQLEHGMEGGDETQPGRPASAGHAIGRYRQGWRRTCGWPDHFARRAQWPDLRLPRFRQDVVCDGDARQPSHLYRRRGENTLSA